MHNELQATNAYMMGAEEPERPQPVGADLVQRLRDLVGAPKVDLDEALSDDETAPCTSREVNYKAEYMAVGATVGTCFPECEATTLDLVRLLIHENTTYRIALGLPLYAAVLARVEADSEAADHD